MVEQSTIDAAIDADVGRTKVAAKTKVAVKLPGAAPSALAAEFERRLNALQWDAMRALARRARLRHDSRAAYTRAMHRACGDIRRARALSFAGRDGTGALRRRRVQVFRARHCRRWSPRYGAAIYPHLARIANRWCHAMGGDETVSGGPGTFAADLPARRPDQADAATAALRRGRLQLPAPGPLWRSRLSSPADLPAEPRPGSISAAANSCWSRIARASQSRGEAVVLEQGEAIIFATSERPVAGSRGHYRVTMRHGVSRVRHGRRLTLGIIFHDAK